MQKDKVLLLNTPLWYYQSVPTDLIYATYQFMINGIQPIVKDLNLEMLEMLIKQAGIEYIFREEEKFYDINSLHQGYRKLDEVFDCINDRIYPSKLGLNFFTTVQDIRSLNEIEDIIEDGEINPYFVFFQESIERIPFEDIRYVGISLYHPDQIIPVFTLANMIRKKYEYVYIQLYGNFEDQVNTKILFQNCDDELCSRLFKYFNSIAIGEAYKEIVTQYKKIIQQKEISTCRKTDIFFSNEESVFLLNKNTLEVIPQNNTVPADILNINASIGCYWSRCSYCSIKSHSNYRKKTINEIIEMLKDIQKVKRFAVVRFRDCCISPYDLELLSEKIIQNNIDIAWCCRVRFEEKFNKALFKKLHNAGCIMLSFGIESFDENVSMSMNKGIDVMHCMELIRTCYSEGIAVKLTAIINYPTESYEQAIYNIKQIERALDFCVDIKCNQFILFNNTEIARRPSDYNVVLTNKNDKHNFPYYLDYENSVLSSDENKKDILKKIELLDKSYSPFASEEHLLLYLKKFGLQQCMNIIHQ